MAINTFEIDFCAQKAIDNLNSKHSSTVDGMNLIISVFIFNFQRHLNAMWAKLAVANMYLIKRIAFHRIIDAI